MFFKNKKVTSKTVFIIEDNEIYAKILAHYLQTNSDIELFITPFQTGENALKSMDLMPDYIIIDYFLNSTNADAADGMHVATEIRKVLPKVKIIFLSSQTDIGLAMKAIKEKGFAYFMKNSEAFHKISEYISKN